MQSPTVDQVRAASDALAAQLTTLVAAFEAANPGCIVHSLPIFPATKTTSVTVHVKVQIG